MNIVLIGMRGSWKSTVGRLVAEQLGYELRETDALAETRVGQSIADYVNEHGWDAFREREAEVVQEVSQGDNTVISTGGGIVLRRENIDALKSHGYLIFLYAPVEFLLERINRGSDKRPMLTDAETLEEDMQRVWEEREPLYRSFADAIIDTTEQTPPSVAEEVRRVLKENKIV